MSTRKVSESLKKSIAGNQFFKCANKPGYKIKGMNNYLCPLWAKQDINIRGSFDQSGYDIDHIIEHCISHNDDESNLQALCKSCHSVKTATFMRNRRTINTIIIDDSDTIDNAIIGDIIKPVQLHPLFDFIKNKFILQNKNINCTLSIFYTIFSKYIHKNNLTYISKIAISKLLAIYNLGISIDSSNMKHIKISSQQLFIIFKNNNWLHN